MSIELFKKIIQICSQEQLQLVDSLNETERDLEKDILRIKKRIDHINLIIQSVTNYMYLLKEQEDEENYTKS
jgi:hypothetical protein